MTEIKINRVSHTIRWSRAGQQSLGFAGAGEISSQEISLLEPDERLHRGAWRLNYTGFTSNPSNYLQNNLLWQTM